MGGEGYEEKFLLNDIEVLTSKTPEAFAFWFSNKLVNGYLRWCRLNRAAMDAAAATAGAAAVDCDDYTIQSEEEEEVIMEEEVVEVHSELGFTPLMRMRWTRPRMVVRPPRPDGYVQ